MSFQKGHFVTEEMRQKIRISKLGNKNPMYGKHPKNAFKIGHIISEKHKQSLSNKYRGKTLIERWGEKKAQEFSDKLRKVHLGRQCSEEHKRKLSEAHKGKYHSEETKKKIGLADIERAKLDSNYGMRGKHHTEETRKKMRDSSLSGENSHFWKGGITPEMNRLRKSLEWKFWRKVVFERDNYECCCCLKKGELHPHHIIPVSEDKSQVFDVTNGITLCKECHFDKGLGLHQNLKLGGN